MLAEDLIALIAYSCFHRGICERKLYQNNCLYAGIIVSLLTRPLYQKKL